MQPSLKSSPLFALLLLCGCKEQGWVTLPLTERSQTSLSYDASSIRQLPDDVAIVNAQWSDSSQTVVQTAVLRFDCKKRLFRQTSMMVRHKASEPFMPELRNSEDDHDVIPNGGWEEIMIATCDQ